MTNSMNRINPMVPSYSGVTINIINPAVNIPTCNTEVPYQYRTNARENEVKEINNANELGVNIAPQPIYNYQTNPNQASEKDVNNLVIGNTVPPNYFFIPQQSPVNEVKKSNIVSKAEPQVNPEVPQPVKADEVNDLGMASQSIRQNIAVTEPESDDDKINIIEVKPQSLQDNNSVNKEVKNTENNAYSTNNVQETKYYTEAIRENYNAEPKTVNNTTNVYQIAPSEKNNLPNAYPQVYYLNNFDKTPEQKNENQAITPEKNVVAQQVVPNEETVDNTREEINMDTSKEIIAELDERRVEQKETEKNGKKIKVVSLTNEYIMSLENYLNNPNTDIRLMAAKEILTRLDEDKGRYNDAALNALLNKMLQDPNKLIRIAALGAFASELACGNDYTVELLKQIQQDPQADPEDVLEASQILLKRTTSTEIRYIPVNNQQKSEVEEQ